MARGTLRIFLGAAPGVGMTFAMLQEAHQLLGSGRDVAVGIAVDHGRLETRELMTGLELVTPRAVEPHGVDVHEMDVDAVLARHPDARVPRHPSRIAVRAGGFLPGPAKPDMEGRRTHGRFRCRATPDGRRTVHDAGVAFAHAEDYAGTIPRATLVERPHRATSSGSDQRTQRPRQLSVRSWRVLPERPANGIVGQRLFHCS